MNTKLPLLLLLLAAAVCRFADIDLMEFKHDEVAALELGGKFLRTGNVPTRGLVSSLGIPNPPFFIYLLAPWQAACATPAGVALLFPLAGVFCLLLLALLLWRVLGPWPAALAVALLAASPWPVLFSRKIWSVDLSAPWALGLMLLVFALCRRPDSRAWALLAPLAACNLCLHFSGLPVCLATGACLLLLVEARRVRWRWLLAGLAPALLVLLPYCFYLASGGAGDILKGARAAGQGPGAALSFLDALAGSGNILFAGGIENLAGPAFTSGHVRLQAAVSAWSAGMTVLLWSAAAWLAVGLMTDARRAGRDRGEADARRLTVISLCFLLAPVLVYAFLGVRVRNHYFLVSLPAGCLCLALAARRLLARKRPLPARLFLALLGGTTLALGGCWLFALREYLLRAGGTRGDYGEAYRFQARVARLLARSVDGRTDVALLGLRDRGEGVRYLVRRRLRHGEPVPRHPARRVTVVNLLTRSLPPGVGPHKLIGCYAVMVR